MGKEEPGLALGHQIASFVQRTHSMNRQWYRTEKERIKSESKKIDSGNFSEMSH